MFFTKVTISLSFFLHVFRVDPKKTRYIGAICGLGVDPHTKRAALPDNDIELPFDVKIDLEDILKVTIHIY